MGIHAFTLNALSVLCYIHGNAFFKKFKFNKNKKFFFKEYINKQFEKDNF